MAPRPSLSASQVGPRRSSGTEPLIRVMVEAEDQALMDETVETLADLIRRKAGAA